MAVLRLREEEERMNGVVTFVNSTNVSYEMIIRIIQNGMDSRLRGN